jgi:hypothetical protein
VQRVPFIAAEFATVAGSVIYAGQIVWYRFVKPLLGWFEAKALIKKKDKSDKDDDSSSGPASSSSPVSHSSSARRPELGYLYEAQRSTVLSLPTVSLRTRAQVSLTGALIAGTVAALVLLVNIVLTDIAGLDPVVSKTLSTLGTALLAGVVVVSSWRPARAVGIDFLRSAVESIRADVAERRRRRAVRAIRPSRTVATLSNGARRWLWYITALDIIMAAAMLTAGNQMDQASGLAMLITLGGRHEFVLVVAAVSSALLIGLALTTHGFVAVTRIQIPLIVVAGTSSAVALAGVVIPLILLTILIVVVAALLAFTLSPILRR